MALGLALRRLARIDTGDVPRVEIEDGWRMAGAGDTVETAAGIGTVWGWR